MKLRILETAEKELEKIANPLNKQFGEHIEKIDSKETIRHLKRGLPYLTKNVTKQARIVYCIKEETVYILHCFKHPQRIRAMVQVIQVAHSKRF